MKKIIRLLRRHKRLLAQCAIFTPLAFFSGLNFFTPLLLILGALTLYGLRALYGNDPYVQENADKFSKTPKRFIDPNNTYLGLKCYTLRKRIYGY